MQIRPEQDHIIDGKFQLQETLGSGGIGTVYSAYQLQLDRKVAIKFLNWKNASEEMRGRFEREAAALSMLQHKNIVGFYGYGVDDARGPYIAMEYLSGTSLQTLLAQEERLPLNEMISICRQVCEALHYAHKQGIAHRDLKPGNIMLLDEPGARVVKVVDFGLAKMVSECNPQQYQRLTATGVTVGSFLYMSPEQCTGQNDVDHQCDIYSLGCIMYECLMGEPPFLAEHHTLIMQQHLRTPTPAIQRFDLSARAHESIQAIIAMATQKDRSARYQSAQQLIDDLDCCAAQAVLVHACGKRGGVSQPKLRDRATPAVFMVGSAIAILGAVAFFKYRPALLSTEDFSNKLRASADAVRLARGRNSAEDLMALLSQIKSAHPEERLRILRAVDSDLSSRTLRDYMKEPIEDAETRLKMKQLLPSQSSSSEEEMLLVRISACLESNLVALEALMHRAEALQSDESDKVTTYWQLKSAYMRLNSEPGWHQMLKCAAFVDMGPIGKTPTRHQSQIAESLMLTYIMHGDWRNAIAWSTRLHRDYPSMWTDLIRVCEAIGHENIASTSEREEEHRLALGLVCNMNLQERSSARNWLVHVLHQMEANGFKEDARKLRETNHLYTDGQPLQIQTCVNDLGQRIKCTPTSR